MVETKLLINTSNIPRHIPSILARFARFPQLITWALQLMPMELELLCNHSEAHLGFLEAGILRNQLGPWLIKKQVRI